MTPEQRLDRLERIAKLMVKAGLRARSESRRQIFDARQRIDILVDAQIGNEARFAALAESQIRTDRRLDALIDIVQQGRQGNSSPST